VVQRSSPREPAAEHVVRPFSLLASVANLDASVVSFTMTKTCLTEGKTAMTGDMMTPDEVFRTAWGFSKATDMLAQGGDGKCAVAEVVNEAFCLELYLKCLLMLETGNKGHGHKLKDLFDKLSQTNQAKVERYYNEDLGDLKMVTVQRRGKTYASDLNGVLQATSDSFVEWRYLFEEKMDPKPILGWQSLRASLLRLILELRPDWKKHQ
jgi:hypothetical protein